MKKNYFLVYAALMGLLVLTTASAYWPLGSLNAALNLGIAVIKASLIIAFFMHVRLAKKPVIIFVTAGFVWLIFLTSLTLSDYFTRGLLKLYGK